MALRGLGTGGNRERLDLVDNSALDMPGSGWTLFAMFYPDTGVGVNSFAYLYAHGAPLANVMAINVFLESSSSKVRFTIDHPAGNLVDMLSTNTINTNAWNSVAVQYDGLNARVALNGIVNTDSPPAIPTTTPAGNARIGDATHGPGREMNGRIAHVSKWDRAFSVGDLQHFTSLLISPEFAQDDHIWHVPIWNATNHFDQLGVIATTPVGALYGNHAPATYPATEASVLPIKRTAPPTTQIHQVQWTLA